MDLALLFKITPVIFGIFGAAKVFYDLVSGGKTKLREEYKFAKEFLVKDVINDLHPYAKEKGYQAIAGTSHVTEKEIEYILSLSNPVQRLSDYKKARLLFETIQPSGEFKLKYKNKYESNYSRNWRKLWYLFCYAIFGFLAASPFVVPDMFGKLGMLSLILTLPSFGFYALVSLNAFGKIKSAERLVANKNFHTSSIVLDKDKVHR